MMLLKALPLLPLLELPLPSVEYDGGVSLARDSGDVDSDEPPCTMSVREN